MADEKLKTVVVLGGAYAGARAVQILSKGLPEGWRIILVDRNTHINHVYVFPRLAVLPGHEHKGFVPFDKLLTPTRDRDLCLHALVRSVHSSYVVLDRSFPDRGILTSELHFDYLIYALGSRLPAPLDLWGSHPQSGNTLKDAEVLKPYTGTKQDGIAWLKAHQEVIKNSESILVVGGGALGIQFATDIYAIHPGKDITLLHSRHRLLPRFDEKMHTEILDTLIACNIQVILGERLDTRSVLEGRTKFNGRGQRVIKTLQGREVAADLILLCTGQKPNTHFLSEMDPRCVNPHDGLAHVLRTMQLGTLPTSHSTYSSECTTPTVSWSPSASSVNLCSPEEELEDALAQIAMTNIEPNSQIAPSLQDDDSELNSNETEEVETTPYQNIFVVGDAADAFGAIPAGHTAYYQGEVAARNILRLIRRSGLSQNKEENSTEEEPLEDYMPGLPAIKISLGLTKSAYQANGVVRTSDDGVPDLNAAAIWAYFGYEVEKDEDMYA
ncbi:FAD/NAD-binding domain-containing protein [Lentinula detonsa]|uniref:FAD/NAD-binding domain-containing protein n=1 Tax=Lentinula detonsa TaxID=2804962 RepID=A0AA38PSI1_9AGAR|nr:FAD/NAD-binding domain-containing protein [Lentinula detonsa]